MDPRTHYDRQPTTLPPPSYETEMIEAFELEILHESENSARLTHTARMFFDLLGFADGVEA